MRSIPKQYILKDYYPKAYLNREDELKCHLIALESQYDRWIDDLLDRIRDLEDENSRLKDYNDT